jgi:hypothetical protein
MWWKLGERVDTVPKRALANSDRTLCFYEEDPPSHGRDGAQRGPGLSYRLMWSARQGSTPLAKNSEDPPSPLWHMAQVLSHTHTMLKPAEY